MGALLLKVKIDDSDSYNKAAFEVGLIGVNAVVLVVAGFLVLFQIYSFCRNLKAWKSRVRPLLDKVKEIKEKRGKNRISNSSPTDNNNKADREDGDNNSSSGRLKGSKGNSLELVTMEKPPLPKQNSWVKNEESKNSNSTTTNNNQRSSNQKSSEERENNGNSIMASSSETEPPSKSSSLIKEEAVLTDKE